MRVALVGEAPSDTSAVAVLLQKVFPNLDFFPLLRKINGAALESQRVKRQLRREYEIEQPSLVIFIRDLDALESDKSAIGNRKSYFREFNSVVDKVGVFLLNIFELEALILADIAVFNECFGTEVEVSMDVMQVVEPKEFLKTYSKLYNESWNVELFSKLNPEIVQENCRYFKAFMMILSKNLN